jgi:hypothetical protein
VEGARAEKVKTAKCINYRQKEAENGPASFYIIIKGILSKFDECFVNNNDAEGELTWFMLAGPGMCRMPIGIQSGL